MIWVGSAFLVLVAVALIIGRRPVAHWQGMIGGGTMPPGCVVGQALALIVIALALLLLVPRS